MLIYEVLAEKQVWARNGMKVVRKYRCSGGMRNGRVVASPAQCFAPIDMKKRIQLKKLKAKQGPKMLRKAQKTKRVNPASRRLRNLNRK